MGGVGYGSKDADGSWGFKATADGKVILGNTSDDVIQVTGSLEIDGDIQVAQYIKHRGDTNTYIQFTDDRVQFEVGNLKMLGMHKKASSPHQVTVNSNNNNVDFVVNSNNSSTSPILRTDADNARVGIGTASPSADLDVDGTAKAGYYVTAPTATDLGSGTSTTLTPSTSLHFLDADSVTLDSGKDYFEITLADGTTDGQHLQLAITTAANNPVRVIGDSGGAKAAGTIAFTGVPADGQGIALSTDGSTSYAITMSTSTSVGNFTMPDAATVVAGINGSTGAADMAWLTTEALNTGILAGWGFTTTTYSGGNTTYIQQASAGTSGNQTITENMDNATVTGFSGGTALVEGSINSTYGVALAGTSAVGGLLQGAHFVWDATSGQWQIIAGTQLTS